MKLQTIFHRYIIYTSTSDKSIFSSQQIGLERQRGFRLVIDILNRIIHYFGQSGSYFHPVQVHSC